MNNQTSAQRPGDVDYEYGFVELSISLGHSRAPSKVEVDSSDRLLIAGYRGEGSGQQAALARLLPDGRLDLAFGEDGVVLIRFYGNGSGTQATSLALDADERILVCGRIHTPRGLEPFIARFQQDGTLDLSYAQGEGIHYLGVPLDEAAGPTVSLQPDGKALVTFASNSRGALARILADGVADSTFGPEGEQGVVYYRFEDTELAFLKACYVASGAEPDRIIVMGYDRGTVVAGLTTTGELIPSFGWNGYVREQMTANYPFLGFDMAVQSGGRPLVCGGFGALARGASPAWFARYTRDGTPDPDFNHGSPIEDYIEVLRGAVPRAMVTQADGKILVTGAWYSGLMQYHVLVARYLPDGAGRDLDFGNAGTLVVEWASPGTMGQGIALQSDGRALVICQDASALPIVFRVFT